MLMPAFEPIVFVEEYDWEEDQLIFSNMETLVDCEICDDEKFWYEVLFVDGKMICHDCDDDGVSCRSSAFSSECMRCSRCAANYS